MARFLNFFTSRAVILCWALRRSPTIRLYSRSIMRCVSRPPGLSPLLFDLLALAASVAQRAAWHEHPVVATLARSFEDLQRRVDSPLADGVRPAVLGR